MLLIKNDPKYNEQWPRPLVPYRRIYGIDEPTRLSRCANDGKLSPHLPEGTPFGLVGTSSLYKRESYPGRRGAQGQRDGRLRRRRTIGRYQPATWTGSNWSDQGADAGIYDNSDIHAIRILGHGADDGPRRAEAGRLSAATPASGCASSARFPRAPSFQTRTASSRSIRTAIPTPASWPRFPRTRRSRSRPSTSTAWC